MATPLPPRTPGDRREDFAQRVAESVAAIYAQAEEAIVTTIAALARRVAAGTMAFTIARRRLAQTVNSAFATVATRVHEVLRHTFAGAAAADDLSQHLAEAAVTASQAACDALTAAVTAAEQSRPKPAINAAPSVLSLQRQAAEKAVADTRGGLPATSLSLSRIQAAQKALDELAEHGITGFVDRTGRQWELVAYVEMATRTAVSNAWDELQQQAAARSGIDMVIVATHSAEGSCPRCLPWLGKTLSLTGSTPGTPTLAEAKAAGFRHPNCRCFWTPLGAALAADVTNPVALDRAAAVYAASQRQRALERRVRRAHRELAAAVTPAARATARRNLAAARAASAEHRHRTGLVMTQASVRRREHGHRAH